MRALVLFLSVVSLSACCATSPRQMYSASGAPCDVLRSGYVVCQDGSTYVWRQDVNYGNGWVVRDAGVYGYPRYYRRRTCVSGGVLVPGIAVAGGGCW